MDIGNGWQFVRLHAGEVCLYNDLAGEAVCASDLGLVGPFECFAWSSSGSHIFIEAKDTADQTQYLVIDAQATEANWPRSAFLPGKRIAYQGPMSASVLAAHAAVASEQGRLQWESGKPHWVSVVRTLWAIFLMCLLLVCVAGPAFILAWVARAMKFKLKQRSSA